MSKKIDVQNLDYTMALLIRPLIEQYKKETTQFPGTLYHLPDPMAEWHARLDKMIAAFELIGELKGEHPNIHDKVYTIYNGLKLFSEHYLDLRY